jgi:hypothetical protein
MAENPYQPPQDTDEPFPQRVEVLSGAALNSAAVICLLVATATLVRVAFFAKYDGAFGTVGGLCALSATAFVFFAPPRRWSWALAISGVLLAVLISACLRA